MRPNCDGSKSRWQAPVDSSEHNHLIILLNYPHKHAIMGQYRAITDPMLPASDQYWPGTGPYWHVYRVLQGRYLA